MQKISCPDSYRGEMTNGLNYAETPSHTAVDGYLIWRRRFLLRRNDKWALRTPPPITRSPRFQTDRILPHIAIKNIHYQLFITAADGQLLGPYFQIGTGKGINFFFGYQKRPVYTQKIGFGQLLFYLA
jgi:hypothetical protein